MKKRLILAVSCLSDYTGGIPSVFTISIGYRLAERIIKLSEVAWGMGVSEIVDCNEEGVWSDTSLESEELGGDIDSLLGILEQDRAAVGSAKLHVNEDEFYFTAIPEGCDDELRLTTRAVRVSVLEDEETVIIAR